MRYFNMAFLILSLHVSDNTTQKLAVNFGITSERKIYFGTSQILV